MGYEFNFDAGLAALPQLAQGLLVTVALSVIVMSCALPLGLAVALGRIGPSRSLRALTHGYTELFRTTPLLVQISWVYYVLPLTFGIRVDSFVSAVMALGLNLAAFLAEAFRGSIQSIDPGQREAGLATGMSEQAVMRRIILPQAVRRAVPVVASNWVALFKNTSLVAVIGVHELMFVALQLSQDTYRPMEMLTIAAIIYFVVTFPQSLVVNRLFEKHRVVEQ